MGKHSDYQSTSDCPLERYVNRNCKSGASSRGSTCQSAPLLATPVMWVCSSTCTDHYCSFIEHASKPSAKFSLFIPVMCRCVFTCADCVCAKYLVIIVESLCDRCCDAVVHTCQQWSHIARAASVHAWIRLWFCMLCCTLTLQSALQLTVVQFCRWHVRRLHFLQ